MNILFDYQAFEIQSFGGVSHSYAELISHLRKNDCVCQLGLKESNNVYIQNENVKPLHYTHDRLFGPQKRFPGQRTITRIIMGLKGHRNGGLTINQDYCISLLKQHNFDIFEPTYFDSYFLPYLHGKPFVITVHDMIFERIGCNDWQTHQKKLLCPLAAAIHVPSENTKTDLINILYIDPDKVSVIPHGGPSVPEVLYPSLFSFPYILYVGDRWSYKNFIPFVDECSIIVKRLPSLHIVCTGSPFTDKERKIISEKKLTQHFIHHLASEQELQALYQNAVAFIYPSAYEGFGMPILEAFACGCPVILNNASCFPEVGGDAAIFFDINNRGELAEQIISLYQAPKETRDNIIGKGKERLRLYSWENSAKKIKQIYENILKA